MPKVDELVAYIRKLRNEEDIPLHFRRTRMGWYVWYGYSLIAYRANRMTAHQAVDVAATVHMAIHDPKVKVA